MEEKTISKPVHHIVGHTIAALGEDGGFTINATTGKSVKDSRWHVGGIIPELVFSEFDSAENLYTAVEEWYEGAKALDGENVLVGGWCHDGFVHIDLVSLFEDEEEAVLIGRLWNQIAIARINEEGEYVSHFIG